jgi:threonine dehydratase
MRFAFENFRVVLEPAAVVGLAALLSGKQTRFAGKTLVVFATGGNVDATLYADVISRRDFDAVV